jgi:hypothetical protein
LIGSSPSQKIALAAHMHGFNISGFGHSVIFEAKTYPNILYIKVNRNKMSEISTKNSIEFVGKNMINQSNKFKSVVQPINAEISF